MSEAVEQTRQRIADRLRGRNLLVTGATGFLAKVFIEKLLRSVPEVGRIHLLVRCRADGTTSQERFEREVLRSSVFGRLRASLGPRFDELCREKIRVVDGDLTKDKLGLSDDEYLALTEQLDIVVNSAAAVTFDERLDVALALNALGPSRLLALARDCNNAGFMQVSTCYVSGRRSGDIPEELAGPVDGTSINLDDVVERMRQTADRILAGSVRDGESRQRKLIAAGMDFADQHGWNDTYTFTKWLAEQLIDRDRGDVPMVILRPAIIEGSYEEPLPGWIDGLRMADPMIMAFGHGKLGEFPANPHVPIDIIPVDLVANAMLAALRLPGDPSGLEVYQVASSARNPLRVSEMTGLLGEAFRRCPMTSDKGKPIRAGTLKLVPREEFDRKWRRRLARAMRYRRLLESLNLSAARRRKIGSTIAQIEQLIYYASIYSPYTHLDCRFLDDRLRALADSLHPDDRREFSFAAEAIDWSDYLVNRHIPGLRKFVLGAKEATKRLMPTVSDAVPDDREFRRSLHQAKTIFDAFQRSAALCENKVALQIKRAGKWVRYTYNEALAATATIAKRFAEHGLVAGDRVVICGENSPEWGLTYLAAMRAGLVAVPLDLQMPPEEVLDCARFTEAKLLCAGSATIEAISAAADKAKLDQNAPPIVRMTDPFVPPPGTSRESPLPVVVVEDEQTASILFTSGTTVSPKAVPLTHANFLSNARSSIQIQPIYARDSFLSVLPMHHAFEFTCGFLIPLVCGATITYVEQLKGPQIMEAMQASGTTVMLVVPRLLGLFHDAIQRKVRESGLAARSIFRLLGGISDLSGRRLGKLLFGKVHRQFGGKLRIFAPGGSQLDPELYHAFSRMGFVVAEGYGLTETAPVLTINPPDGGKPGSAGLALPGIEFDIRNANNSGIGELWVRGPNVMQGYLNNPEATAEVFRNGWFRTGDLCRCDADGYYYITGRVKDMIVTDAGKNVYPDEVEVRYKDLPFVKEICVLGMPHANGIGESVQAVIVPDYESAPDVDPSSVKRTIREAATEISAALPTHQHIQKIIFWNADLPKTSTLKAKRSVIRSRLLDGGSDGVAPHQSPSATAARPESRPGAGLSAGQSFVVKLLARLSHNHESSIQPDTNLLLDLGLDSLMKLQVIAELEGHFDVTCSDEAASAVARVSDLFAIVGDRQPISGKAQVGASWRDRLLRTPAGTACDADGRTPIPLLPARWAARAGVGLFLKTYVRVRAEGLKHVPKSGPVILAANHTSHLDSASVVTAIGRRRRIWSAAAQDYFFNTPIKSWVFGHLFDAIPFDRHAEGLEGLRLCVETLKRGDGLLFFPEGTRSLTGLMQPFKIGVAVMAIEGNAPVIPTRIDHAYDLFPKGQRWVRPGVVRVTFGEPVSPDPWRRTGSIEEQYEQYRELARYVQSQIASLGAGCQAAEVGTSP